MIDWASVDWAVVGATVIGPVAAVAITLWSQKRADTRRGRTDIFVAMMKNRRVPTNVEFVGALNLVPVHFYADKSVLAKYSDLMATFSDPRWENANARPQLIHQVNVNVAYLLSEMSIAVRRPIQQLQILEGGYAPQGWSDEQQELQELRQAMTQLLDGNRPLPIVVVGAFPTSESLVNDDDRQQHATIG